MEIKKVLNEDYETDSWDDGEVAQGKSFFEDGYDWKWIRRISDVIHLDFDNWAAWMAFRPEDANNIHGRNVVAFFIVDEDTGFIDWGPVETPQEALEFLESKKNDWEMDESLTHSPLSTAGEIPYAVKLLYMMDRFVMDVYDNEGWLMNGVPDGEFEETTADEAMKNYTKHFWLIEDDNGGIDWDDFNDFIDTFASVTKSKSYDQEERRRLIDEADSFVGEYEKYGDDNDEKLMKMLNDDHDIKEDLEGDLDKVYKFENAHEHPSILDNIKTLEGSELVDHITPVIMYDTEVFEMVATDGRVFYLVPSTLSQFDVYDEDEELVTSGEFTRSIPNEVLMDKSNLELLYELVGGEYAGTYTEEEVKALPCFSGRYSRDWSKERAAGGFVHRAELDNKPQLDGYLGPMMGGYRDSKMVLRYETQDVYDRLSESWHEAYQNFISIIDDHFPDEEKIEASVEELYNQHKGDPDWDEAYRRWHEEDNDLITEDVNKQDLESTLRQTAESKLFDMGYDEDFISEYFGIKVEDIEDHIKVNVWGELSYEEFSDLADVLNPIIEKEDPNAYLDNETSGRMVAYIRKDQSEDIPNEQQVAEWSEEFNACSHWEDLKDVYEEFSKVRDTLNSGTIEAIYKVIDKKVDELKPVEESLVKNPDQEGPYSKKQLEQDLYWLTDKFTREDTLKCGYKEEADYSEEILSQHYETVKVKEIGKWFHVIFKNPFKKKSVKEGLVNISESSSDMKVFAGVHHSRPDYFMLTTDTEQSIQKLKKCFDDYTIIPYNDNLFEIAYIKDYQTLKSFKTNATNIEQLKNEIKNEIEKEVNDKISQRESNGYSPWDEEETNPHFYIYIPYSPRALLVTPEDNVDTLFEQWLHELEEAHNENAIFINPKNMKPILTGPCEVEVYNNAEELYQVATQNEIKKDNSKKNKSYMTNIAVYACNSDGDYIHESDNTEMTGWTYSHEWSNSDTPIFKTKDEAINAVKQYIKDLNYDVDETPYFGQFNEEEKDYFVADVYTGNEELDESLDTSDYTIEYYLNTAGRERRPTTAEDIEDYITDTFEAADDYDAVIYAITLTDGYEEDETKETYPTLNDAIEYLTTGKDWSDGSPFVVKLSKGDKVIYDSGESRETMFDDLDESFPNHQGIDLDKVVMNVANLLDDSKLGDNWIEVFPTADAYPISNGEYGIRLEITGADESARKAYFRTKNGRVEVAFVNGSEAMCDDEGEIARFIAGEYGLNLNESISINEDDSKFNKLKDVAKLGAIDWLSEHEQAWEDITRFFGSDTLEEVDLDDILAWVNDHKQLSQDFWNYFKDEDFPLDESKSNNEDFNKYRDEEGHLLADKWYASVYPDDEVGIEQLNGLTMDDILKDRKLVGHCDTQVRDRVYKQLDKYSPRIRESWYNEDDHRVKTLFKNDKYIVELHPDAPMPYWVIDATVENPLHAEQCFYDEERAIRFAEENSLDESKSMDEGLFNDYIYLFPELDNDDIKMMAGYNIKYLGMNHGPDGSEDNWVVYGAKEDIEKYAEKYLGYELHPDYLYEYDDFAGEIV
jgi:hypothetical protein